MKKTFYFICLLVIGLVSVFDVWASIMNAHHIYYHEKNPIARLIIQNSGLYKFILAKSVMTIVVTVLCWMIIQTKYRISIFVVAVLQIILFFYLNFSSKDKEVRAYDTDTTIKYLIKNGIYIDDDNARLFYKN